MALAFGKSKGKAQKTVESYTYKDGENTVRLVGGILARYVYWLKGTNNKDIPVECLSFDREKEKFTNKEVDHVPAFFPDKKCSWSYVMMCLDPTDGKLKPINLKKKLFEQIMSAAEDGLGDPTNLDTGWDIQFKKVKTGPLAYNIEYILQVLKCKNRALNEDERAAIESAEIKTIDEVYIRPTPADIKSLLERIVNGGEEGEEKEPSGAVGEAIKDL